MSLKKKLRFIVVKSVGQYINTLLLLQPQKALSLSYALFSQPRIGKLKKDALPKVLHNTISETIRHNEHQFQTYVWEGNETKILLVHGWESNSSRWKKTLPYLKESGSTIIALDAPAHGQSSGKEFNVPLYAEFIQKTIQKHQPTIIIGHSIGGAACIYHQYLHPNSSIEKMVILGAPSDLKVLLKNYVSMLSLNTKLETLLEKRYFKNVNHALDDFSGKHFASKIAIPGLIIHDTHDKIVAIEEGKKIASAWKNARFIETNGLGHSLHDHNLYTEIFNFLFKQY